MESPSIHQRAGSEAGIILGEGVLGLPIGPEPLQARRLQEAREAVQHPHSLDLSPAPVRSQSRSVGKATSQSQSAGMMEARSSSLRRSSSSSAAFFRPRPFNKALISMMNAEEKVDLPGEWVGCSGLGNGNEPPGDQAQKGGAQPEGHVSRVVEDAMAALVQGPADHHVKGGRIKGGRRKDGGWAKKASISGRRSRRQRLSARQTSARSGVGSPSNCLHSRLGSRRLNFRHLEECEREGREEGRKVERIHKRRRPPLLRVLHKLCTAPSTAA